MKITYTFLIFLIIVTGSYGQVPPPPVLPESSDNGRIRKVVEEMPSFPGCEDIADRAMRKKCADKKMLDFVFKNIQYPEIAKEKKVEGMVVIRMIVEKDGMISNSEIVRDIGGGCGEEGLRVIQAMPKWNPGKLRNQPVRVQMNFPIKFKL